MLKCVWSNHFLERTSFTIILQKRLCKTILRKYPCNCGHSRVALVSVLTTLSCPKTSSVSCSWNKVVTCEWCAGSADSPAPVSSRRGRVWPRPPQTGRSAADGIECHPPTGGPPPWTCPPRPGMSTWDKNRGRGQRTGLSHCEHTRGLCHRKHSR